VELFSIIRYNGNSDDNFKLLATKLIKHFNPKKKLVLSGASALFTCSGAPPTSFFLGLKMFMLVKSFVIDQMSCHQQIPSPSSMNPKLDYLKNCESSEGYL